MLRPSSYLPHLVRPDLEPLPFSWTLDDHPPHGHRSACRQPFHLRVRGYLGRDDHLQRHGAEEGDTPIIGVLHARVGKEFFKTIAFAKGQKV